MRQFAELPPRQVSRRASCRGLGSLCCSTPPLGPSASCSSNCCPTARQRDAGSEPQRAREREREPCRLFHSKLPHNIWGGADAPGQGPPCLCPSERKRDRAWRDYAQDLRSQLNSSRVFPTDVAFPTHLKSTQRRFTQPAKIFNRAPAAFQNRPRRLEGGVEA